ncbi:cystathionine gamma-lyase [Yinghuangia seranimata]|uniref:cystathionine gamma-lyase n=1 Tax=Yinghuangia seranimata TaxID=408067 RepID=UPI00248AAAB1|nr:cystathionine gamma-lyase [Yinghuangia seranimata]MDI2130424.1 cystathionine gamma-lyase [Yinghuangia seranimata]
MTSDGTRAVHAGLPPARPGGSFAAGPVFAATYHLSGDPSGPYQYGRFANPTWVGLENAVGELEEAAGTVVFPSGMAAISAVLIGLTEPGDTVVLPSDGYPATRGVGAHLAARGVTVRPCRTDNEALAEAVRGATLVLLESPSNPGLEVCDLARVAELAHSEGALVAVDNTLATPLGQRPLALGADISLASGTKALTGHSDVLLGYVAAADPALAERVRAWRTLTGGVPGPMEAWLAQRSLATLQLRLERQAANALALAELLADRPGVTGVRHPGRPGDPAHAVAAAQMRYFGSVVAFVLPDQDTAERFLGALELVFESTSFGGVHSMAERRGRWPGDDIPPGFIRFSVGCEDTADLLADVAQALDKTLGTAAERADG